MKSERVENWWRGFEWCILNTQKVWSWNKLKKMKCLSNRRVFIWNPHTSKEIVTRSASSFSRNPLNFLALAMWVKWWYHANFQPFQSSFVVLFNVRVIKLKKISKCMKNSKWSQKRLKIDEVDSNGAYWTHKKSGVEIC